MVLLSLMKPYFIQTIKRQLLPAEVAVFLSNHREGECAELTRKKSGEHESKMCTVQLLQSKQANLYSCGKETVAPSIDTSMFTRAEKI
jgi:hypothetical protein